MKRKEYRVVTADWIGFADDAQDAKDAARSDMGGRVHAEETGLTEDVDDDSES